MPTFTFTPDFRTLNTYLHISNSFDEDYSDYIPEPIDNTLDWQIFEDEKAFEDSFKQLLAKYQLINHYDNLLYLTLYKYDQVWQGIQAAFDDYNSKKRAREIAHLLLMLKDSAKGKVDQIVLKSLTETVKITDSLLNDWISKTLIEALEAKKFPIGRFGNTVLQMLSDQKHALEHEPASLDKLKQYAKMRLVNPKNRINRGTVEICLLILNYLNGETDLKAAPGVKYADAQLNFLFDLLKLLKQVDEVDYDEKDYVRTLIINVEKLSIASSKGK